MRRKEKLLKGSVVSTKPDKTVIVEMQKVKIHPVYKKKYYRSKRYFAHDEKSQFKINDEVLIKPIKPKSKNKKWQVVKLAEK